MRMKTFLVCSMAAASIALLGGCSSGSSRTPYVGNAPQASVAGDQTGDAQRSLYARLPEPLQELFRNHRPHTVSSFVRPQRAGTRLAYISGGDDDTVYGFDVKNHNITTTIGGLSLPLGLYVDAAQNLWVANSLAQNVVVFKKNGTSPIKTLDDAYATPIDVTKCPNGTVYVSNLSNSKTHIGNISVYAPGSTSPTGSLADPNEENNFFITCDANNNVFTDLYETINGSAAVVDEYVGGVQSGYIQLPISMSFPGGIKADNAGNFVLSDPDFHTVTEFTEAGSPTGISVFTGSSYLDDIALTRSNGEVLGNDESFEVGQAFTFPGGKRHGKFKLPGSKPTPSGVAYDPGQKGPGL